MIEEFDRYFKDWGYSEPSDEYFERVYRRLPEGLRALLSLGVKEGIIIPQGRTFTLKGLSPKKGPYNWFSRYSSAKEPAPNWEYFIQVTEFVRLYHIATAKGLILTFEDGWMDLALYLNNKLIVCCEVKEKGSELQELIKGIKVY